ncbi:MAG: sigma-70 factor domain-containing protein, partial [Nitrospinota bacterium]
MTFKEPQNQDIGRTPTYTPARIGFPDTRAVAERLLKQEPLVDEGEPEEPPASLAEDPVRLYLREIGKVPLLTAAREV